MPRPFRIETEPPPPLTVEQIAEKYGVPREKSKIVKAFLAGIVSASETPQPIRLKTPRYKRSGARKAAIAGSTSLSRASRAASGGKASASKRRLMKSRGAKSSSTSRRGSSRKNK
jgi:hypothetical protein